MYIATNAGHSKRSDWTYFQNNPLINKIYYQPSMIFFFNLNIEELEPPGNFGFNRPKFVGHWTIEQQYETDKMIPPMVYPETSDGLVPSIDCANPVYDPNDPTKQTKDHYLNACNNWSPTLPTTSASESRFFDAGGNIHDIHVENGFIYMFTTRQGVYIAKIDGTTDTGAGANLIWRTLAANKIWQIVYPGVMPDQSNVYSLAGNDTYNVGKRSNPSLYNEIGLVNPNFNVPSGGKDINFVSGLSFSKLDDFNDVKYYRNSHSGWLFGNYLYICDEGSDIPHSHSPEIQLPAINIIDISTIESLAPISQGASHELSNYNIYYIQESDLTASVTPNSLGILDVDVNASVHNVIKKGNKAFVSHYSKGYTKNL